MFGTLRLDTHSPYHRTSSPFHPHAVCSTPVASRWTVTVIDTDGTRHSVSFIVPERVVGHQYKAQIAPAAPRDLVNGRKTAFWALSTPDSRLRKLRGAVARLRSRPAADDENLSADVIGQRGAEEQHGSGGLFHGSGAAQWAKRLHRVDVPSRSLDWIPEWFHSLLKHRLRELAGAAQNEGAEVPIPIPRGSDGTRLDPFLECQQIRNRDAAFLDSLQKMLPDRPRQVRELNLRQSNRSRKLRG